MKTKIAISTFSLIFLYISCFAQNYELHIIKSNQNVKITKNQNVRVAYPASKIDPSKDGNIGLRGRIDSIGQGSIWIKSRVKSAKPIELRLKDIVAIKKSSSFGLIASSIGAYAVIGGGAIWASNEADVNPAVTTLIAGAAIFPSILVSTGLFYPSKPVKKVGDNYTLKIVQTN